MPIIGGERDIKLHTQNISSVLMYNEICESTPTQKS